MSDSPPETIPPQLPVLNVATFQRAGRIRTIAATVSLCEQGQPISACYLITVGQVEVAKTLASAKHTLATMGPGAILGLMATFDGGPCSVSMRAVTETTLVEVTPDGLRCLFRDRGALGLELAAQLTTLAIQHLRRTTDNLTCVLYDAIAAPAQAGHVALLDMATVQSIAHAWQAAYSSR